MRMLNTIESIFSNYKGILATDESTGTIQKRFNSVGMESPVQSRPDYRLMLFSTPG